MQGLRSPNRAPGGDAPAAGSPAQRGTPSRPSAAKKIKYRRAAAAKVPGTWGGLIPKSLSDERAKREAERAERAELAEQAGREAESARLAEAARREDEAAEAARAGAARSDRVQAVKQRRALLSTAKVLKEDWDAFAGQHGLSVPSSAQLVQRGWAPSAMSGAGKEAFLAQMTALLNRTHAVREEVVRVCTGESALLENVAEMLSPYVIVASSLK